MTQTDTLATLVAGRPLAVGILLFPEVEVLDFAGPFEVFSVAARLSRRDPGRTQPAFTVATVAERAGPVAARHGLSVVADYGFADAPVFDVLIVPGGVVDEPLSNGATLDYVRTESRRATLTASVCTGVFILAKVGLVTSRQVTTHWEDIGDLRAAHPDLDVVEDVPFVDTGDIVTSAGISAGIAMSLHLVGRALGVDRARRTARQMQFDWEPAP